jgi:DNA-binding XRE family transcriptional regulator
MKLTPAQKLGKTKRRKREPRNIKTVAAVHWETSIRAMRESLRLSLRDVASAVGLAVNSYWKIEQGCEPTLSSAWRIAEFYGRRIDELWEKKQ